MSKIDANAFLLDMDGVIYRGSSLIPGAVGFLKRLAKQNKHFLLLTNNSEPTPGLLCRQLNEMGVEISESAIYTSAMATAAWARQMNVGQKVMVFGESGLLQALTEADFELTNEDPDWVVVGECRHLDYDALCVAVRHLMHGARLVGTNPDTIVPNQKGLFLGCGAVVAALERASGQKPTFIGKPEPFMYEVALTQMGVCKEDTVMIGDNMNTDILGACNSSMRSALVLSGITCREDLCRFPFQPTWVIDDVGSIEL